MSAEAEICEDVEGSEDSESRGDGEATASHVLVKKWEALYTAVAATDWATAREVAIELENDLRKIVDARSRPGVNRKAARRQYRDGLYAIGWQRFMRAPADVQAVLRRYNATLHRIPGSNGPQSRK